MRDISDAPRPVVSVVLPVLNEAQFLRATVISLLAQETPDFDLEVLVVDGNSTDGSAAIVRELSERDARVRWLLNEKVKTPFAFNLGLRAARGEYVCILGAHAAYPKDYIAVCLRELKASGAVGCSGRALSHAPSDALQAQLACWVSGHPFGSSGRSFRTQPEGYADTIPYPVMEKAALLQAGGYNEELSRNQDNDMNQKLRAAGHTLYCTWKTQCVYYTQRDVKSLLKYAFRNGYWNVVSLKHNAASMGLRHFVPFFFVLGLLLSAGAAASAPLAAPQRRAQRSWPLRFLLGLHLACGVAAALQIAKRERDARALLLPPLFLSFHIAYGAGSLWAFLRESTRSES